MAKTNKFSWNLFRLLAEKENGNLLISTYAIHNILSVVLNGATGSTQQEMMKMLDVEDPNINNVNMKKLNESILNNIDDTFVNIKMANGIWIKNDFDIAPQFVDDAKTYYQTNIDHLDSAQQINSWIADQTNGTIKELVKSINLSDVLLLTNVIYFDGKWLNPFRPDNTARKIFKTFDGQKEVDMMHETSSLYFYDSKSYQAVLKPYGDYFEAVIVLPTKPTKQDYIQCLDQISSTKVPLSRSLFKKKSLAFSIPKFSFTYDTSLINVLDQLGMKHAFTDLATFENMIPTSNIYISQAIHKTFISFDEAGTKAAAANSMTVTLKSVSLSQEFKVDRPFFLFIRHKKTNQILFSSLVQNP